MAVVTLGSLVACDGDAGAVDTRPIALVTTDTVVGTGSELLGGVYDIAVSPDGDLHIADFLYKHVLVVGPDGAVRDTIGRQGSGPGEFQLPYVIYAGADSVRVFDAETNLVHVFDGAGAFVRSHQLEVPSVGAGRAFRADGSLAASVDGFDSAMVVVVDQAGAALARFGEPIVPPTSHFDFRAIKDEIRGGRVPAAFRNNATVAWGPDESVYVAFYSEPEVRRYAASGALLWTQTLDEPVFRSTRERFVQRNIEEQSLSRLHSLQYVTDIETVDGDLWLLVNTRDETDGLLLVLRAEDGAVRRRITFPGLPNTGYFTVDASRRQLYMAPRGEASVFAFELPDL